MKQVCLWYSFNQFFWIWYLLDYENINFCLFIFHIIRFRFKSRITRSDIINSRSQLLFCSKCYFCTTRKRYSETLTSLSQKNAFTKWKNVYICSAITSVIYNDFAIDCLLWRTLIMFYIYWFVIDCNHDSTLLLQSVRFHVSCNFIVNWF